MKPIEEWKDRGSDAWRQLLDNLPIVQQLVGGAVERFFGEAGEETERGWLRYIREIGVIRG